MPNLNYLSCIYFLVKLYKNESSEKKETMIRDENIDEKPIILESGEAVAPAKHMSQKKIQSQESSKGDRLGQSIPEIVDNYSNSYTIFRVRIKIRLIIKI